MPKKVKNFEADPQRDFTPWFLERVMAKPIKWANRSKSNIMGPLTGIFFDDMIINGQNKIGWCAIYRFSPLFPLFGK